MDSKRAILVNQTISMPATRSVTNRNKIVTICENKVIDLKGFFLYAVTGVTKKRNNFSGQKIKSAEKSHFTIFGLLRVKLASVTKRNKNVTTAILKLIGKYTLLNNTVTSVTKIHNKSVFLSESFKERDKYIYIIIIILFFIISFFSFSFSLLLSFSFSLENRIKNKLSSSFIESRYLLEGGF